MAAGLVKRLITTATNVSQQVYMWAAATGTPDDNITPAHINVDSAGLEVMGRTDDVAWGSGAGSLVALLKATAAKLDTIATDIVSATGVVGAGTAAAAARVTNASDDPNRPRAFAAVGTTLTRPGNSTPYTANDSISDNATAASVTAQPVTVSDVNDDTIVLERIRVVTSDTNLAASHNIRVWVYGSDPTASSGVAAGDNVAYSNKKAGFLGTMSGAFRAGHSDGGVAVCTPDEGSRIIAKPGSGAKTLWLQYQSLDAFTPSGSSTTLIPTVEGVQGRA